MTSQAAARSQESGSCWRSAWSTSADEGGTEALAIGADAITVAAGSWWGAGQRSGSGRAVLNGESGASRCDTLRHFSWVVFRDGELQHISHRWYGIDGALHYEQTLWRAALPAAGVLSPC